jgi:hypothetical protein
MMTPSEVFRVIQSRLRPWFNVEADRVLFVPDEALVYNLGGPIAVPRSAAFTIGDTDAWGRFIAGDLGWLHANLLLTAAGDPVISLRRGPDVAKKSAAPDELPFSINVSKEASPLEWTA